MKIYLKAGSKKNYIVTTAIGSKYLYNWKKFALPLWKIYCKKHNLDPVYLSYFVPWDSDRNYQIAKRFGFRHLDHEYVREGTLENYNQIDSIGYLLGQYLKYPNTIHETYHYHCKTFR